MLDTEGNIAHVQTQFLLSRKLQSGEREMSQITSNIKKEQDEHSRERNADPLDLEIFTKHPLCAKPSTKP